MHELNHGSKVAEAHVFTRFLAYESEQLICIYNIEIAGQCKIAGWNGIPVYKRVAIFEFVFSLGAVP